MPRFTNTTVKPVNPSQLSAELAGAGVGGPDLAICASGASKTIWADVATQATLDNGITAHTAVFPSVIGANGIRTSDLTLTANTFTNVVSVVLSAGTWILTAQATVLSPSATAQTVTARLWNGSATNYASAQGFSAVATAASVPLVLTLGGLITVAATTTVWLSVLSTVASVVKAAAMGTGAAGNTATQLSAMNVS